MRQASNILVFGVAAAALLGGIGYGWRQLTSPPPIPPVPPLNEIAIQPPPTPEPAPPPAPPAPVMPRPQPQSDPARVPVAEDRQAFQDLRRNCYTAAANNRNGEYPALQAAACDRYAQFADAHGWYPGALPGYAQPAPQAPAATQQANSSWDQNGGYSPQPVYLGRGYDLGTPPPRPPRQPQGNAQPPGQIGPNYTPPPLQQPPPVSQHQPPTRPAPPVRTH